MPIPPRQPDIVSKKKATDMTPEEITRRDYQATAAMQTLLATAPQGMHGIDFDYVARRAYEMADAMKRNR